jgi:hypothetical protein
MERENLFFQILKCDAMPPPDGTIRAEESSEGVPTSRVVALGFCETILTGGLVKLKYYSAEALVAGFFARK